MAKQLLFLLIASFATQLIAESNGAPYEYGEPTLIDFILQGQRKNDISSVKGIKAETTVVRPLVPELHINEETLKGQILKDQIMHDVMEALASLTVHEPRSRFYFEDHKRRGPKKTSTPAPGVVESFDSILVEAAVDYVNAPLERGLKKNPQSSKVNKCTTIAPEAIDEVEQTLEQAVEKVVDGALEIVVQGAQDNVTERLRNSF